jgi:acyl dehydratase
MTHTATCDHVVFDSMAALNERINDHLGYSGWLEITQDRINLFAEATGDYQWIHVDVERAAKEDPFGTGGTIAHGYLTMSLGPVLAPEVMEITGATTQINYGANKVRFPSPVPVGSRVRLGVDLLTVTPVDTNVADIVYKFTTEVEGAIKPACVAEVIIRVIF